MNWIEAILLGIIQGLTEFLPVSSSGHLELGKYFLGVEDGGLLFSIVVHAATALATVVVFRKDIGLIIKGLVGGLRRFEWNVEVQFSTKILISMLPVGIVGVFFKDWVEELFEGKIGFVSLMLALTGLFLLFTHLQSKSKESEKNQTQSAIGESAESLQALNASIGYRQAFAIGLMQAFAVLPGISRSGSTIAIGLLLGVHRAQVARFSFLMVLPPIVGATLLELRSYFKLLQAGTTPTLGLDVLGLGFLAAFLFGWLACMGMLELVRRQKLIYFAIYCLLISVGVGLSFVLKN
ncbi:undecaprenyl-diphosphate phosphatase [Hugenholtzia roseola]|uniref:undecaprenyl-diphosphate phosphatase n=1 Tax=Hugenholtzia roseola TaxID=1002 RepID=UPI0003F6A6E6|nr:undecaprenyl-diphosphate phosphatase [Hugenholtzia roseola]